MSVRGESRAGEVRPLRPGEALRAGEVRPLHAGDVRPLLLLFIGG